MNEKPRRNVAGASFLVLYQSTEKLYENKGYMHNLFQSEKQLHEIDENDNTVKKTMSRWRVLYKKYLVRSPTISIFNYNCSNPNVSITLKNKHQTNQNKTSYISTHVKLAYVTTRILTCLHISYEVWQFRWEEAYKKTLNFCFDSKTSVIKFAIIKKIRNH